MDTRVFSGVPCALWVFSGVVAVGAAVMGVLRAQSQSDAARAGGSDGHVVPLSPSGEFQRTTMHCAWMADRRLR